MFSLKKAHGPVKNNQCRQDLKSEMKVLSYLTLVTQWTVACQAPLCMEFPRQEYWSGWPFPSPRDLPNPGIKPRSPALQVDSLPSETPQKPFYHVKSHKINSLEPRIFFCIGRTGPGTNLIGSMTEWSSSLLKPH